MRDELDLTTIYRHEAWWEWVPEAPYHLDAQMMPGMHIRPSMRDSEPDAAAVAPNDIFELTISMPDNHTGFV